MTRENKQLLFQELSARFPYGVKVFSKILNKPTFVKGITDDFVWVYIDEDNYEWEPVEDVKLYLRPMSSMTEEERYELQDILGKDVEILDDFMYIVNSSRKRFSYLELIAVFEWFNSHHFDYRGLIEKGLVIEVTKDNNPYEA